MKRVLRKIQAERLDIAALHRLLRYEPETGKLYWRERTPDCFSPKEEPAEHVCRRWNARYANKEGFTSKVNGYFATRISGRPYLAHRVAWALYHGFWPADQIDHLNGKKTDNRIENLREANNSINGRNQRLSSRNTSGAAGVNWIATRNRWKAAIKVDGKTIHLGWFKDKERAIEARLAAEARFEFGPNHGRRA